MSCCGSCAHGRKCEGKKNPLTRKETAVALREARSYAKAARTALGKGRRTYFSGRADGLFEAAHKYGKTRKFRHVSTTGKTMGRNPNFLYMTNRRRRNPEASTNFIYEANGKRQRNPTFGPRKRIRFLDYRGQVRTGTTVMRAAGGCGWVVNMGGRYGTPAVVPDSAIITSAALKRRNGRKKRRS